MTTEDRALTERKHGALIGAERDGLDAFGDLKPDEMILPTMKLVQGTSREADPTQAGNFYNTVTKDYKAVLTVAVLAVKRSRSLFKEGDFDAPPLCASDDAVRPREQAEIDEGPDVKTLTGPDCNVCPFAQWGTARGGKGRGQACQLAYNLLCLDLDDDGIYIVRVSGTSIDGFRRYFTAGRMQKTPAYATPTQIGSKMEVFDAGQAYVLTFAQSGSMGSETAQEMRQAAAAYRGVSLGVDGEEQVSVPQGDDTVEDAPFE
jgi:hypothetical protein